MKALILAAGFGSRLMPLTANVPKTMVKYKGKRIIEYEIQALKAANINEIAVVGGYKFEILREFLQHTFKIERFFENKDYAKTNMLYSLFCAREFLLECIEHKQDIIISYADIVYFKECVEDLKNTKAQLAICVDMQWQKLWQLRFDNVLDDAESLKMQGDFIIELGKKPQSISEIEAQYMGLFKFSWDFLDKVIALYDALDKNALFDGQNFHNIYMTSFLQALIDKYHNAKAVRLNHRWCEIDFKSDLDIDIKAL